MIKLTEELEGLYQGYRGDEAWEKFVNNFPEAPDADFLEFGIPGDIVKTLISKVGPVNHSKKWLVSNIPALDYCKPIDILRDYDNGEIVIRSVLMRMP